MTYVVYLSGEIHSSWRQEIIDATRDLDVSFTAPVTDHPASDAAGDFLGSVEPGFWRDQQSSGVNAKSVDSMHIAHCTPIALTGHGGHRVFPI